MNARILCGHLYRYVQLRKVEKPGRVDVEEVQLGLYLVEAFATEAVAGRDMVIYSGQDGRDLGRIFVCSLADFAVKFRPLPEPEAPKAEPVPAKQFGYISTSIHL